MPSSSLRSGAVPLLSAAVLAATFSLSACSPALDWRDVRPTGSPMHLLMPCKPGSQVRPVALAGQPVRLTVLACAAGGQTWGLAFADLGDPGRVSAALAELGQSAAGNIGAAASRSSPFAVPGATPNPASVRLRLEGAMPDGKPVQMQLAVFTHGTLVFQATAYGERVPDEAAETFFNGLRIQP